jgi:hypothetical protein
MPDKASKIFYSSPVEHRELPGQFLAQFAAPGELPMYVMDDRAKPKLFPNAKEAELAGYRVLAKRINNALQPQEFRQRAGAKQPRRDQILVYRAPDTPKRNGNTPSIEQVFGKKK